MRVNVSHNKYSFKGDFFIFNFLFLIARHGGMPWIYYLIILEFNSKSINNKSIAKLKVVG